MTMLPGVAVKAFIVNDGKVLLLKRSSYTKHKPNAWDIPGGRLEPGENPFDGLSRETKEESGLEIEIVAPIDVNYFKRDDGQQITMIIFFCKPKSTVVKLSKEHDEFKWVELSDSDMLSGWLEPIAGKYNKYYSKQ